MTIDCANEIWLPVTGFEGLYEVSDCGRVRSLDRMIRTAFGKTKPHKGRILRPQADKDGYPRIILHVDGIYHTRGVHRLVALAFHASHRNALHNQVDHIDGNRGNAAASNLRWVSGGENHYFRRGLERSRKGAQSKLTIDQAREIKSTQMGYGVTALLARRYGVPHHVVVDVQRGRTWKYA